MRRLALAVTGFLVCGSAVAEALIEPAELAALRSAKPGDRVAVSTVPRTRTLLDSAVFKRIEVYAPDAKIYVPTPDGVREVERSSDLQFVSVSGPRIALALAADGRSAQGTLLSDDGQSYVVAGRADGAGLRLDVARTTDESPDREPLHFGAGIDALEVPADVLESAPTVSKATTVGSRQAVIAIDTDNELMNLKFANNTTNATNYIAALFGVMNAIYERDLDITLVQGTTFLRTSNVTDPFSQQPTPADGNNPCGSITQSQLTEFGTWWQNNQSGTSRVFVAMLSGKMPNNCSAGLAWVLNSGNYCALRSGGGGGYSFSMVFKFSGSTASDDGLVVPHEIGHNFGAFHTHCTDITSGAAPQSANTIDQCYPFESGCYAGGASCPAAHTVNGVTNVTGTLMSYCHVSGISGCSSARVFADAQRTVLAGRITSNMPTCITVTSAPNQAPSVTAAAGIAVTEDVASSVTGISFADADSNGGSEVATFSVASGVLSAVAGGGITVGGTSSALTLTGTITSLNAFVSAGNLKYTTTTNANGSVALAVQINDNGNSGTGGALTGSGASTLNIAAVNDAPTIAAPALIAVAAPGATALEGIVLADVDAASGSLALNVQSTQGTLLAVSGGGVSVSGSATANVTLTGTLANLAAFLATPSKLSFVAAAPLAGDTATLGFALNDNGNTGSGGPLTGNASSVVNDAMLFRDGFE